MKATAAARPGVPLPGWAKIALIAIGVPAFLGLLAVLPLPLPPYLDFQVLYQTDMGLLRGIAVYDHAAQVQMIAQLAGVTPGRVILLPFPYPPWYALMTAWLAWLPIQMAARLWFGISLLFLLISMALLTEGWSLLKRVMAFALAFFYLPVLGSLLVGQYGFPLLLGAALMIYALRHEKAGLTAVAAALLTLKPHLGALLLLVVLIHLWHRHDDVGRRAMFYVLIAGIVLFAAGFLADRAWPVNYARSLAGFQKDSGVTSCELCAGLPGILASRMSLAAGLELAFGIGAAILAALIALWLPRLRPLLRDPVELIALTTLIVLLASPYLLNYDFVLLLVPLALLAGEARKPVEWMLLGIAYLLPFVALGVMGRQGNLVFPLCAALLMGMLYWRLRSLDVLVRAA